MIYILYMVIVNKWIELILLHLLLRYTETPASWGVFICYMYLWPPELVQESRQWRDLPEIFILQTSKIELLLQLSKLLNDNTLRVNSLTKLCNSWLSGSGSLMFWIGLYQSLVKMRVFLKIMISFIGHVAGKSKTWVWLVFIIRKGDFLNVMEYLL